MRITRVIQVLSVASLIALFAAGVFAIWPRQVMALRIPHIAQSEPGEVDLTQDGYLLEVASRRWGRTTITVRLLHELDPASRVELFWLEAGKLRRVVIADKGRLSTSTISVPQAWPLVMATVDYNPLCTYVVARRVAANGHSGGFNGSYDSNDPMFTAGIETWGQAILEKVMDGNH